MEKNKTILIMLIIISVLGILLSSYLTYLHYKPTASKFCIIGENFDCDIVNKSVYSQFLSVPVAIFGLLTYLLFLITSILLLKNYDFTKIGNLIDEEITVKRVYQFLLFTAIIGFLFSLYLTYIEGAVLKTYCIFCLISFSFIIIILLMLSYINFYIHFKKPKKELI